MTNQVLDPEQAMQRELEKKKAVATHTIQVIKTEFIREYLKDFGELPDLTNPMINMFYNGWLAAQGSREWLSPEEERAAKNRKLMYQRRSQASKENRAKRRGLR
jgi:hypothetical protein